MFIETRGNDGRKPKEVDFESAVLEPTASYGGLYVPKELKRFEPGFCKQNMHASYAELALDVFRHIGLEIDIETLKSALSLYARFDDMHNPAPLHKLDTNTHILELYHGPTRAFKDMALVPFGELFSTIAQKKGERYLIMAATSGDTGPATLDTFKNKENIKVACIYPDGGTSDVQRLQMSTQDAKNLKVIGIKGDFDDAQSELKKLLADGEFLDSLKSRGYKLSAANSVNFGRIAFQIIYHIWGYLQLLKEGSIKEGEKIYIIVPSGNFGNALGAFYAKEMGLPVEKILIASNNNNILTELINTGRYDLRDKQLQKTLSPAMDILKSSNVERILFLLFGSVRTKYLMEELEKNGFYELSIDEVLKLKSHFGACFCDDEYTKSKIKEMADKGYIIDPHTATAFKAIDELLPKDAKCVICSTAEWTKFAPTLIEALENKRVSDKEALDLINKIDGTTIHDSISSLFVKQEHHTKIVEKEEIKSEILGFV